MIGKLSGRIDTIEAGHVLLDVSGVGYIVQCSARTLSTLGGPGVAASLLTEMHAREDGMFLYGFADAAERHWFRLLTSVQGVGARTALALLSVCPADRIGLAIAAGDRSALQRAEGVGPKLAARILTELKDKAGKIALEASFGVPSVPGALPAPGVEEDAVSVLVNLGYARAQAVGAVGAARVAANGDEKLDTLIRLALRQMNA
jgi:Holliday junction DNA helicase RuvA